MMQQEGDHQKDPDDDPAAVDETWLRPVWEDDEEELDAPPLRRPTHAPSLPGSVHATGTSHVLLAPLAGAAAALARSTLLLKLPRPPSSKD